MQRRPASVALLFSVYATFLFFLTPAGRRWLLVLLGLLGSRAAQAQILNDSSKTVYGPKTTRVIYESELRRDSTGGTVIDTALVRFPQERFWLHDSAFQQNLGALGTASHPLLYQPNLALGTRLGRNAFDRNTRDASLVPYYDSRSPYSFFRFLQSSAGEQVFELSYSRSLKKNFSVGIDYERSASNQVLATSGNQWLVEHNNFTFFSRFQTEDGRYHLLFNYNASRQRTREQGAIWPTVAEDTLIANNRRKGGGLGNILFNYDNERVYLTAARNIDDRDQVRLFQSYRLARRGFTAYHILDVRRQFNGYNDDALPRDATDGLLFYPTLPAADRIRGVYRNATATDDRATYRQLENTVGLLGRTDRVEYNVYGRVRNASLKLQSTPLSTTVTIPRAPAVLLRSGTGLPLATVYARNYLDAFVGGTAAFNYRTIYAVEVAGEYKFFNEYWLRGTVRTGPLSAELLTSLYSPTLTQQKFIGNHYTWPDSSRSGTNLTTGPNFSNTTANQLTVRLQQRLPLLAGHSITASAAVVNLTNYVYYDQQGRPAQAGDAQRLLVLFARHRFELGKFHFDNQATFTTGASDANATLRIPALVTESRAYYQTSVFGKALFGQIGAEFYYQSSYRGYGYAPSTQQFYVQDNFLIPAYGIANVYVAADIKAASIFLKGAYVNQGLTPESEGYFAAPYLTGYPRRFQLGVRWRFFN